MIRCALVVWVLAFVAVVEGACILRSMTPSSEDKAAMSSEKEDTTREPHQERDTTLLGQAIPSTAALVRVDSVEVAAAAALEEVEVWEA